MLKGKYSNRLDTAALRTAFYEAMATVSITSLAANHLNDPELPVLTPNHLLTTKPTVIESPQGDFDNTEIYGKAWVQIPSSLRRSSRTYGDLSTSIK